MARYGSLWLVYGSFWLVLARYGSLMALSRIRGLGRPGISLPGLGGPGPRAAQAGPALAGLARVARGP